MELSVLSHQFKRTAERQMVCTIDIDTGGTFTDGFFTRDGEVKAVKVLTTPHDLTECFLECIKAGAAKL
ncbi:MAG: hypothetical protein HY900_07445, partial [Deltaproteobacteria bacterium]|nr:hypothetical protein [Deltaproteobacteria bacterium]